MKPPGHWKEIWWNFIFSDSNEQWGDGMERFVARIQNDAVAEPERKLIEIRKLLKANKKGGCRTCSGIKGVCEDN